MDNKPSLPEPPATEEPPLQQTPEMLNQQTAHSSKPTRTEVSPQEKPTMPEPPKKKTWLIVVVVIAVIVLASIVAGVVYWAAVLNPINNILDEQNEISQMMEEYQIESIDELMAAYETQSPLNCHYSIILEDEAYDVSEQANAGWQAHKIIAIGNNSSTTALVLNGDSVYSWGYSSDGEEFATRTPWNEVIEAGETDELTQKYNVSKVIVEAKDTISGLVCVATDDGADFSFPDRDWVTTSY